jgi:hypothetical protein
MASLITIGNYWNVSSGELYEKFLGGCLVAAYNILNEDVGTTNHAKRLIWAQVIMSGTDAEVKTKVVQMFRYALASNATIQTSLSNSSDNDINFVIASQIDLLNP